MESTVSLTKPDNLPKDVNLLYVAAQIHYQDIYDSAADAGIASLYLGWRQNMPIINSQKFNAMNNVAANLSRTAGRLFKQEQKQAVAPALSLDPSLVI